MSASAGRIPIQLTAAELGGLFQQAGPGRQLPSTKNLEDAVALFNKLMPRAPRDDEEGADSQYPPYVPPSPSEQLADFLDGARKIARHGPNVMAWVRAYAAQSRREGACSPLSAERLQELSRLIEFAQKADRALRGLQQLMTITETPREWHGVAKIIAEQCHHAWKQAGVRVNYTKAEGPLCKLVRLLLDRLGYGSHTTDAIAQEMRRWGRRSHAAAGVQPRQ